MFTIDAQNLMGRSVGGATEKALFRGGPARRVRYDVSIVDSILSQQVAQCAPFAVGALHAKGGRSVTVVPSTSIVDGEPRSRIVAMFPQGSAVTVPRGYADIVVSEYGIARLKHRTLRERVHELIAIAHPDVRADLRSEAARLYGA